MDYGNFRSRPILATAESMCTHPAWRQKKMSQKKVSQIHRGFEPGTFRNKGNESATHSIRWFVSPGSYRTNVEMPIN